MVRIALDPTPYNNTHHLLEFPDLVAGLGYEYLQLTPNPDFGRQLSLPESERRDDQNPQEAFAGRRGDDYQRPTSPALLVA